MKLCNFCQNKLLFNSLLIIGLGTWNPDLTQFVIAQSSPEELSFFRKSPRLVRSATSYTSPNTLSSYFFEIQIPTDADKNLQTVIINQQKNRETIRFLPDKTKVLIINGKEKQIPVNVSLNRTEGKNELTIDLSQPIQPGEKFRIALRAINPRYGGIYQFGVTVFPEGDNPRSLYLGIGRLHFQRPGGRP